MNKLEELKRYFHNAGITQTSIAKALNTSTQYVSGILNGTLTIGKGNAMKLQDLYGVNAAWILTGQGKMLLDAPDPEPEIDKDARIKELEELLAFYKKQMECLQKAILREE